VHGAPRQSVPPGLTLAKREPRSRGSRGSIARQRARPGAACLALTACLALAACGRIDTVVGSEVPPSVVDAAPEAASLPRAVYLEAEDGKLAGFTIATDPATSGGEYILPPSDSRILAEPGDASAGYTFTLAAGTYYVWGRIRSPGVGNNTLWVTLDDGGAYLWRLSTGVAWYWGRVTEGVNYFQPIVFGLDAGAHSLVVQNADPGVGLDRLYVTSLGDTPVPANDTPCDPPNSIQLEDGGCELSCGSQAGGDCVASTQDCRGSAPVVAYDCAICCHPPPISDGGTGD
jgi:hypothetical protein